MNGGSSSLKLAVFGREDGGAAPGPALCRGVVEGVGGARGRLRLLDGDGAVSAEREGRFASPAAALDALFDALGPQAIRHTEAVGHRIVHGGEGFERPRRLDAALREELTDAARSAPLHLPAALELLDAARRRLAGVPHVACFDGAFHAELPEEAVRLPLPEALHEEGMRRIGFHGLSFASVVARLGDDLAPRTVIAHLGSGASLVALREGRPVETTMGMTPAGGVVMATRSGDLDPGVLIRLLRERGWGADRLEDFVNRECGLRGIAGGEADVRALLDRRGEDPDADLALRVFARSVRKAVGALAAVLEGIDLLVFTGGVGENAPEIRREICQGLSHLGIDADAASGDGAAAGAPVVRTVETDEEREMAAQVARVVGGPERAPEGGGP